MFPMELDPRLLSSLPYPGEEGIRRVIRVLLAIVSRRIIPYFRKNRGTDPIDLAKAREQLFIQRLEDDTGAIKILSFVEPMEKGWGLLVQERIFDYLAFVIPSDPDSRLGDGTREEKKMLALAEFLLRHELEHVLYKENSEQEVILNDVRFAMEMRKEDPTYYRALAESLGDEMNGIMGRRYLNILEHAQQGKPLEGLVGRLLDEYTVVLAQSPTSFLERILPNLDAKIQAGVLGYCFRQSRNTALSLTRRAGWMEKLLGLLRVILARARKAQDVLEAFKERWGMASLLHELDVPETLWEGKGSKELLELLNKTLDSRQEVKPPSAGPPPVSEPPQQAPAEKSLKDRIGEAAMDPLFPREVLEVIEKNKLNAVGHSGSKYSELIETLLAIPWGKLQPIEVSPEQFQEGLNRSHYGLEKPKEILCDFFSNLIWRYRKLGPRSEKWAQWKKTGSSFLLVGPPGVGKTSLAISVAQNLSIPYHKISLGGMKDEADLRGHGFTYEGSKPGAIVQGLIRMGVMNGMFIMDEADKTEKFAIATLLEILDPEQNHLFHDKFTQTTVDIDLSNSHFILTANTLETVPPPVANRCEIIFLDRYSVEEKIAIAKQYLIRRVREKHQISEKEIFFDPDQEKELLRLLVRNYTHEAGVRELERAIRTLFLRIQRKEILGKGVSCFCITRESIKEFLDEPQPPRKINPEDRIGEMLALGVNPEMGIGSVIPIQATSLPGVSRQAAGRTLSVIHATGNIERVMDESRKVATTALFQCASELGLDMKDLDEPVHLHFMGASSRKDGPSAGGAIALALASLLSGKPLRRDVAMTGEIDTRGRITAVGGIDLKLETAFEAGCKTMIIPSENLRGEEGLERLPRSLREELQILSFQQWQEPHEPFDYNHHLLQVVAVEDLVQAARVAFVEQEELCCLENLFQEHAQKVAPLVRASAEGGLFLVLIKDVEEMDPCLLEPSYWEKCGGCVLLVTPAKDPKALDRLDPLRGWLEVREFDPRSSSLKDSLRQILSQTPRWGQPNRISISAPFFFLQRDGISPSALKADQALGSLRLFSNNYTIQRVKIKACKAILNQVYFQMNSLEDSELEHCPFLTRLNETWVVDLSFIPEKYRLDVQRAEKILTRCLNSWLKVIEG
ncbi:MAG: S16 family serine protease [bacterium]